MATTNARRGEISLSLLQAVCAGFIQYFIDSDYASVENRQLSIDQFQTQVKRMLEPCTSVMQFSFIEMLDANVIGAYEDGTMRKVAIGMDYTGIYNGLDRNGYRVIFDTDGIVA